jgi:hypothetical protein
MVANLYEAEDPRSEPDIEWPGLAADIDRRCIVFESAWARYCSEGVTPSQPSNVAYIGNR